MTVRSAPAASTRTNRAALRIEVLCVVDQQQLDAAAFTGQQFGVRRESVECRSDEFGGAQRRHRRLRRGHPDRGAQQHDLLVGLRELAGGQPFGAAGQPADALQRNGIDAAFGAAGQQIAQFGGESDGAQRRPQLRPARPPRQASPSSRSPASNSRMMPSCSALVISRGGGSPLRWAASRSTANA